MLHPRVRRISFASALAFGLMIIMLIVGEAPIAAITYGLHTAGSHVLPLPSLARLVIEWVVASAVIGLAGYFLLGLPVLVAFERQDQPKTPAQSDIRATLATKLLQRGRLLGFLVASGLGGAVVIAWWYGSHRLPNARPRTMAAAWVLSTTATGYWLCLLSPQYRAWAVGYIVGLVLVGVAAFFVPSKEEYHHG